MLRLFGTIVRVRGYVKKSEMGGEGEREEMGVEGNKEKSCFLVSLENGQTVGGLGGRGVQLVENELKNDHGVDHGH